MARVSGIKSGEDVEPAVSAVFDQQTERWGARLEPYEIYARRPSILHAVLGMWGGLAASGLIEPQLKTLVNRRVAGLIGCVF